MKTRIRGFPRQGFKPKNGQAVIASRQGVGGSKGLADGQLTSLGRDDEARRDEVGRREREKGGGKGVIAESAGVTMIN